MSFTSHLAAITLAAATAAVAVASPTFARAEITSIMIHDSAISGATSPDEAVRQARARLIAHDAPAAIAGLERYLRVYPEELAAARFLGDLYFRSGDFVRAEATYRGILEDYRFDAETHHRLAMLYTIERRIDLAIKECEASLPESIDDLVALHARKGDLDAFEREMEQTAAVRTHDSDAQYEMAEVYDDLHLPADAETFFKRALALYPKSTIVLNGLAIAQMELRDDVDAERTFADCLAQDERDYACTNDLGSLYLSQKRFDDARRQFERAHTLAPEAPEALVNLGYLADERGDRKSGAEYYELAIYQWPYATDAYVDLAFDRVQEGLIDAAEGVLLKGLAIAPQDARMHFLLGIVDEVHGKRPEAIAEFEAAQKSLDPEIARLARENADALAAANARAPQARRQPSPHR